MKKILSILVLVTLSVLGRTMSSAAEAAITGELKRWHKVSLTFTGPAATETGALNPFLD